MPTTVRVGGGKNTKWQYGSIYNGSIDFLYQEACL